MARVTFDLDFLRSFVTGIELGSYARAADRLARSTSAVSAQLKKLEEQAGTAIVQKSGRGLTLTPAGEVLFNYAKRLIALNDEAVEAVRGIDLSGSVRLGVQEDFSEHLLTTVLARFVRTFPQVCVEVCVARNALLLDRVTSGELDLALAWESGRYMPHKVSLGEWPVCWIGYQDAEQDRVPTPQQVLPLVMFDTDCLLRQQAVRRLDEAGVRWRMAFTSSSLSGIWAAVESGLGVTVRTPIGLPAGLSVLSPAQSNLPLLPDIGLALYYRDDPPSSVVSFIAGLMTEALQEIREMS